ncbi:uncharacterized protein [Parasteatoda tepidariorum]|uniref:uncharacterized protein n=1 Tax=Parasteatoda tepidariorum TaxID=114398 RepID=UPI0039BD0002
MLLINNSNCFNTGAKVFKKGVNSDENYFEIRDWNEVLREQMAYAEFELRDWEEVLKEQIMTGLMKSKMTPLDDNPDDDLVAVNKEMKEAHKRGTIDELEDIGTMEQLLNWLIHW